MSAIPWTDEQVERLRNLCGSPECGSSKWIARQLNDEFGTIFSKNAIIGKMLRNNISAPHPKGNTNPRKIKKKPAFNFSKPSTVIIENEPTIMPTEFPNKCSLFELNNETCRWPCGDPGTTEFFFCGQPEADLLKRIPYCKAHARASVTYRHSTGMSGNAHE
jgi:GcrA cell cycle regulator